MRKSVLMACLAVVAIISVGCSKVDGSGAYTAASNVTWTVTSGPGGGSDIYTRMITDIVTRENMAGETNFVVTNKTDGGGEVGRNNVANTKGEKADDVLMTFNSGDLMPMVENTKKRAANFRIISIMAVDKQLVFKGQETKYKNFAEAVETARNGTKVVFGGSKGDDIATYEALLAELGVPEDQMAYIAYDSTGAAITAILGGHVDFVIAKPAASAEYVAAGSMIPVLALSDQRFSGDLAGAPTLSEIGAYQDVEVPIWRGVAGPAAMSDEAVAYWEKILKQVSVSDQWQQSYLEKNKLIDNYMDSADATAYVLEYEQEYLAKSRKQGE